MDLATIVGLVLAIGGALGGYMLEGGEIHGLISESSILIVIGATVGATFISAPLKDLKEIPKLLQKVFFEKNMDYATLIEKITDMATIARKEGILALEPIAHGLENKFLANGIMMVVDGMDKDAATSIMETEINALEEKLMGQAKIFQMAGGYCPTMGILGTVMSMISLMKELDEPSTLGPKIAMAFTATLYGVGIANVIFLPFYEKLKVRVQSEITFMEICMEGVLSIQAGESPKVIGEKLSVFLNDDEKPQIGESE